MVFPLCLHGEWGGQEVKLSWKARQEHKTGGLGREEALLHQ